MAGNPQAWSQDPSGGVNVHFDDGSSLLMDPRHPDVATAIGQLPQAGQLNVSGMQNELAAQPDQRIALGPSVWDQDEAAVAARRPASSPVATDAPAPVLFRPQTNREQPPAYGAEHVSPPVRTVMGHDGQPVQVRMGQTVGPIVPQAPIGQGPGSAGPVNRIMAVAPRAPDDGGIPAPGLIRGTPGTLIKGGRTPQSWTEAQELGLTVPEGAKEDLAAAEAYKADAANLESRAATRENELKGEFQGQLDSHRMVQDELNKTKDASRRKEEEDRVAAYEKAKVIDPNRIWNNKSDGEKFIAKFAEAGEEFLNIWMAIRSGQPARKNSVTEKMSQEIARDVEAQQANLQAQSADIQRMYGQWDRQDARQLAGEAAHYEAEAKRLDSWMGDVKDDRTKSGLAMVKAKMNEEAAARKIELAKMEAGKTSIQRHDVQVADRVVGGSSSRLDWSQAVMKGLAKGAFTEEELQKGSEAIAKASGMPKDQALGAFLVSRMGRDAVQPSAGGQPLRPLSESEQKMAAQGGERLEKSGATRYDSLATQAEELANAGPKGEPIPGMGIVDSITPNRLMNAKAYANKTRADAISVALGHLESGAAVGQIELPAYQRLVSGRGLPEDFAVGAAILRREGQRRREAALVGLPPKVQGVLKAQAPVETAAPITTPGSR